MYEITLSHSLLSLAALSLLNKGYKRERATRETDRAMGEKGYEREREAMRDSGL